MNDKLFVIGIGGTGMRALEAFVHTCAMGMYDKTEINILALDTDLENGNFNRLKELVKDTYLKVKGYNKTHYALDSTFFSAKINFYEFCPDYSNIGKNGKFASLSAYSYASKEEQELAKLLLTDSVREFDLKHGYRSQTHLGSLLMYHSILQEVKDNPKASLSQFIQSIFDASEQGNARVFVLGSVFGGTGASSIPIIPKAFNAAMNIIVPGKSLSKAFFGATLLSSYFKFPPPDESQRQNQLVVANSKNFALNSQVAMMFYNEDQTVKTTYQKFYMLGTPSNDFETKQEGKETLTGGTKQKNDSHYIELLSAFAAYDFFNVKKAELAEIKDDKREVQYYFRALNENGKLEFKDFVSSHLVGEFMKKFGMLVALSFLVYPEKTDFFAAAQAKTLEKNKIVGYDDILIEEVNALKKYFAMFHFAFDKEKNITDGWLRQVHRSANGQDNFLFNAELFGFTSERELNKFAFNKQIFRANDEKHEYKTGIFSNAFDEFKTEFIKFSDEETISNKSEKLIKRMYKTLVKLYEFEG